MLRKLRSRVRRIGQAWTRWRGRELPPDVRKIDCSIPTILKQHGMRGPFCHVGSLINKEDVPEHIVARWRKTFLRVDPQGFTGIDLFAGPNVDVVADLCDPDFAANNPELIGKFGTVFCYALLEHVTNPFDAAKAISSLLAPGGHLYYGGPWTWGYHAYPGDYFRISFDGLAVLFPELEWRQRWYMSTKEGVGLELDPSREKSVFRLRKVDGLSAILTDIGLPYLNLGAVGQKPVSGA
jgi:SAM-dependent methyltransferase